MRAILASLEDSEVWLVSAYLKIQALKELTEGMSSTNTVSILCRWAPMDLLSGSSDLESFSYASAHGWSFFVHQDLHAKAYRLGSEAIFIGSGNLTSRGFSLASDGNVETMVSVDANEENVKALEHIFDYAIRIDESKFQAIEDWFSRHCGQKSETETTVLEEFPLNRLFVLGGEPPPTHLMVSECFHSNGSWLENCNGSEGESQRHDLSLLGISDDGGCASLTTEQLRYLLARTKMFAWLYAKIVDSPGKEMYFGELTAELHSALIDDPRPYRKDVKSLLANLLSWIEVTSENGICIDRPNYSQRIYLC